MYKYKKILLQILLFIVIISLMSKSSAAVRYFPINTTFPEVYNSESLFVGMGMIASGEEILVVHDTSIVGPLGMLYYIDPMKEDSLTPLFHNRIKDYADEYDTVKIKSFPRGHYFTLCYVFIDTAKNYNFIRFHRLYSGQNRTGIDPYITDIENPNFGSSWIIVGKIDNEFSQIGFYAPELPSFVNLVIKVKGVYLEPFERNKIPKPVFLKDDLSGTIQVGLTLPAEGLKTDVIDENISIPVTSNTIDIYYTLDGSDPSESNHIKYSAPIILDKTTTIKAMAVAQNDTLCFPSDIASYTYVKDATTVKLNSNKHRSYSELPGEVYTIMGQKIKSTGKNGIFSLKTSSVYFVQSKKGELHKIVQVK